MRVLPHRPCLLPVWRLQCVRCISDSPVLQASSTARQQVQSHCGLEAFPVTSTQLQTRDGMRWLWNVVGDASGGLGTWRVCWGALKGELFCCCYSNGGGGEGRGGTVKYISDRFSISKWFPFSFADVHSVSGFIITPRSAKYEVHEAVKEDPCLVRYDAMLDRKIVTTRLGAPCI